MTTLSSNPAPAVLPAISRLRRALRLLLWIRGLGEVAVSMSLIASVSLGLDLWLRFQQGQRGLILIFALTLLGWVLYRRLWWPISRRVSDEQLCLRIEAACPELRGRMITALEFSRFSPADFHALSRAMIQASIVQGQTLVTTIDPLAALQPRFRRHAWFAAGLGLLLGLIGLILTLAPATAPTLHTWWQRNVLLRDVSWPPMTRLIIMSMADADPVVPSGDDWELAVRAEGRIPRSVAAQIQSLAEQNDAPLETQELAPAGDGTYRLIIKRVTQPMRVQVLGGDAVTPWIHLRIAQRPVARDIGLRVQPPAYTGLPARNLTPGATAYEIPLGSLVQVRVTMNKPIAQAAVLREGVYDLMLSRDPASPADQEIWSGESPGIQESHAGVWKFRLTDQDNLSARPAPTLTIKVLPDRKPAVQTTVEGFDGLATSQARIPIHSLASDDYGLVGLRWIGHVAQPDLPEGAGLPIIQPIALPSEAAGKTLEADHTVEVSDLKAGVGATLAFHVEATDNCQPQANAGASTPMFVKIISPQDMRAELLRREQEQRQELERAVKDQEDLETEIRALASMLAGRAPDAAGRDALGPLLKRQRLLADRIAAIHRQCRTILAGTINNRLEEEEGPIVRRIRVAVLNPLEEVRRRELAQATDALEQARAREEPSARDQALGQSARQAQTAAQQLRAILKHMAKWENYQEAINLLQDALRMQTDVQQATRQEKERRVLELFDR